MERGHLLGRVHRRELPPRRASCRRTPGTTGPGRSWRTAFELFDSWQGSEIVADAASGVFLTDGAAGGFAHHDEHFDITGQFDVPRSPQGGPVIFQAGDSDEGREFAAADADAIFSRHSTLEAGQAFYADVKGRLARYGRSPDQLKILPAATFVLADTDAQARELAHEVRLQQVSGATAIAFLEQLWNRDLSGIRPGRPAARGRPGSGREHHRPRPGQRAHAPGSARDRTGLAGHGRRPGTCPSGS